MTEETPVPIPDAAAKFGLDVKRLRGYVHRNGAFDPIGSLKTDVVYESSVEAFVRRTSGSGESL